MISEKTISRVWLEFVLNRWFSLMDIEWISYMRLSVSDLAFLRSSKILSLLLPGRLTPITLLLLLRRHPLLNTSLTICCRRRRRSRGTTIFEVDTRLSRACRGSYSSPGALGCINDFGRHIWPNAVSTNKTQHHEFEAT